MQVRNLIFDNFLIKVISLLVAIGLWFYVTSKGDLEVNFIVPLELKNVPPTLTVIGEVDDFINIRLKGRHSSVRNVDSGQIHAALDLSDAREGENHYTMMDDNIHAPSDVQVVHISPRTISLSLAPVAIKEVPVRVEAVGSPAPGYRVVRVMVSPPQITIEGPKDEVVRTEVLRTAPIRISGEKDSFSREVRVDSRQRNIHLINRQSVVVTIVIDKKR